MKLDAALLMRSVHATPRGPAQLLRLARALGVSMQGPLSVIVARCELAAYRGSATEERRSRARLAKTEAEIALSVALGGIAGHG